MLAETTISRIDQSKPGFLFHSAGKDSNSIALALAEAGWQDQVTLITHQSKGKADESAISAQIAKQLGFKHQVLHEVDQLQAGHKQVINDYFVNAPFPCTDNVCLAYPLYAYQVPQLCGANIIDGLGNDGYIGYVPQQKDYKTQQYSRVLKHLRPLSKFARSESLFHVAGRMRAEWAGLSGFSYSDTRKILPYAYDVYQYWKQEDKNGSIDYVDFRAKVRGAIVDQEIFVRKVRNFCDSIHANLILPFANEKVASYFATMPEKYLFDRQMLKNKLVLRNMLKNRIGLDSDALGKLVFSYDSCSVVQYNWEMITQEINNCALWEQKSVKNLLNRLRKRMQGKGWGAGASGRLIYRLYLLSAWYNKNKYIN